MGPIASSGVSILKFLRNPIATYDFPGESGPPGGTFHTYIVRRLGPFFFGGGGFKILIFNIFGVFRIGYEDFMDIFLRSSQNWTIFRGFSVHFRVIS